MDPLKFNADFQCTDEQYEKLRMEAEKSGKTVEEHVACLLQKMTGIQRVTVTCALSRDATPDSGGAALPEEREQSDEMRLSDEEILQRAREIGWPLRVAASRRNDYLGRFCKQVRSELAKREAPDVQRALQNVIGHPAETRAVGEGVQLWIGTLSNAEIEERMRHRGITLAVTEGQRATVCRLVKKHAESIRLNTYILSTVELDHAIDCSMANPAATEEWSTWRDIRLEEMIALVQQLGYAMEASNAGKERFRHKIRGHLQRNLGEGNPVRTEQLREAIVEILERPIAGVSVTHPHDTAKRWRRASDVTNEDICGIAGKEHISFPCPEEQFCILARKALRSHFSKCYIREEHIHAVIQDTCAEISRGERPETYHIPRQGGLVLGQRVGKSKTHGG